MNLKRTRGRRGPWATSLTWVTLVHIEYFFSNTCIKYAFHFHLPHLILGDHYFNQLAIVLCQKGRTLLKLQLNFPLTLAKVLMIKYEAFTYLNNTRTKNKCSYLHDLDIHPFWQTFPYNLQKLSEFRAQYIVKLKTNCSK
jgi:hypothetical protein